MTESTTEAGIGHNAPPAYDEETAAALEAKMREFADAGGAWLDLREIADDTQAQRLADYLAGLQARIKETETARKEAKKPHDDAAKTVQKRFVPIVDLGTKLRDRLNGMLTAYASKKERAAAEARRKAEEEARRAHEEADRRAREAAARNDLAGEAEAERAREAAEDAAKAAARAPSGGQIKGSTRTMAMRTTCRADLQNPALAFNWLRKNREAYPSAWAEVEHAIERAASGVYRAAGGDQVTIDGAPMIEDRKVA